MLIWRPQRKVAEWTRAVARSTGFTTRIATPGWPSIQGKVGWPLPSYGEPGPAAGLRAEHRYLRG